MGQNAKTCNACKGLVTETSELIEVMLSSKMKEALERRINFPDVDIGAFEGWLHWHYTDLIVPSDPEAVCFICQQRIDVENSLSVRVAQPSTTCT
jgi:hypothetical protein